MIQKVTVFFFAIFLLLQLTISTSSVRSQEVTLTAEKIEYNLPYPGILPDHPFFFLKEIRDTFLEFTTRDMLKKAELYLLLSDKRIAMSTILARSGKDKQALNAVIQSEEYFSKIPSLVENSKKQGVSASADFIQQLKLSNDKHREVEETFLKDLPQGENSELNKALDLNAQSKKKIERL